METMTLATPVVTPNPVLGGAIHQVYLNPYREDSNIKAFASLNYGGVVLRGLKVVDASNGLFVAPPSTRVNDKWHSPFYIADPAVRARIQEAVLSEYDKLVKKNPPLPEVPPSEVTEGEIPF
ncbi:MAG TPA: septation protein SpoVG family protein [Candidatus Xenobia bacterium]|jgi:DNA-binding cell septation regulator SpoVG